MLYWSAETHLEHSHKSSVEDIQWLPPDVWFSTESAFPKQNPNSQLRQLISCASDNFIYVWDLTNDDSRDSAERKRIIDGEQVGDYGKTNTTSKTRFYKLPAATKVGPEVKLKKKHQNQ